MTVDKYNFMSLIVKIILSVATLLSFSLSPADKRQYFLQFSLNFTLQLINEVSNNCPKLTKF